MERLRVNFAGGTITNNPLTDSGTTLNSAELADLPVVTSGVNKIAITLDPEEVDGDPEIVWITAHSSTATSATISRGEEGTVAREHLQGITWINAPTTEDHVNIVPTDGDDIPTFFTGVTDPNDDYTPDVGDVWIVSSSTGAGQFKKTIYSPASNLTTSSATFGDIDSTNLPALSLDLAVDDVVELSLSCSAYQTSGGEAGLFDWLIDRPTSGDTSVRGLSGAECAKSFVGPAANYTASIYVFYPFVCTEAGVHTFKPQWRRGNAGTLGIVGQSGAWEAPIIHMVKNIGAEA